MPQSKRLGPRARLAALAVVGLALLGPVAGCSRDDEQAQPTSPPPSTPSPSTGAADLPPMTPAQAREDTGRIYENGCYAKREDSTPPVSGDCVYGDPAGRPVILFGDSHAAQWFEAMAVLAEQEGWRLVPVAKMACPPGGESVYNSNLGREYRECTQWHDEALRLIASEQPDLVVVATRAGYYRIIEDGETLSVDESAGPLGDALAADLREFAAMGASPVLIRDTPVPGFNVPDCVEGEGADACTYPFDGSLPEDGYQATAAADTGTPVADVNVEVCGAPSRCLAVVDGLITFRDDDHVAATFGASLAGALGAQLESVT